jgi:eukaryotic translation initiation factor 2C
MQSIQFTSGTSLSSWTYLLVRFRGSRDVWGNDFDHLKATLQDFHAILGATGVAAQVPILPGLTIEVEQDGSDHDKKIDDALERIVKNQRSPKLLLVILPKPITGLYNRVKFVGDVVRGIHTVCVVASKFAKQTPDRNAQYFANVALKFNLKLGGTNQSLEPPKLGIISEGKTMVVGIDVTHPSPGSSSSAPSVAGIVASVDARLGQWPADIRIQASRQEMVSGLDEMLKLRLNHWRLKNKRLPENLLIYRDGVSEGQYNSVLEEELPLLKKACAAMYSNEDTKKGLPNITIIVVGKRHHTRFYPTTEKNADRSSNPQNGTIVDRGVTEPRNWDFFLQAHTAIQGTARPAHYFIVIDEIFQKQKVKLPFQNSADVLEDLTHNMCYLFGRATKAVSVCPPAYYADLVCERARCYLSGVFDATPTATPAPSVASGAPGQEVNPNDVMIHENLKDSMFYI